MQSSPQLIITIDTEEGFDWNKPFTRNEHSTENLFHHDFYMSDFYKKNNITPVSLLSYPILSNTDCQKLLKQYLENNTYHLGTHLHSWVTPPFEEDLSNFNSYAGNLQRDLRRKKLEILTNKFVEVLNTQPLYYKCGRYGIAKSTYQILHDLGYKYDFSPYAYQNFTHKEGFNFLHIENKVYDMPKSIESHISKDISEIPQKINIFPNSAGYTGYLKNNSYLRKILQQPITEKLKLRGILSRFNIMNLIYLTPEGISEYEMKHLAHSLMQQGQNFFNLSYHSSSFSPGGSIYCKSTEDAKNNSNKLKNFINFFQEIGGKVTLENCDLDRLSSNPIPIDLEKKRENSKSTHRFCF